MCRAPRKGGFFVGGASIAFASDLPELWFVSNTCNETAALSQACRANRHSIEIGVTVLHRTLFIALRAVALQRRSGL